MVFNRKEGSTHGDFSFTKAHVAAHQTVHRQRLAHVAQHRVNCLRLIWRGLKREAIAEQLILFAVVFEGKALFGGALGVDIQQLGRYVAHLLGGFLPRARPGVAAQLMQRRVLFRTARVAADKVQRGDRHVQFGVAGVGEHQILAGNTARFQRGHPGIAADAVLQVYHRLANMQLRQVADKRIRVNGATRVLTTARYTLAKQVAFAD